ncbi:MAG: pLS20_p028 family conjugation system transmembrane protein [Clostridium paraputrificum]
MPEAEVIRILLEYEDIFTQSNIFQFIMRFLGWGIIKGLSYIVDMAQGSLDKVMDFLNFFDSEAVQNILEKVTPFAVMLLTLSILYIGYNLMINKKKFDRSKLPVNFIVAILIILLLPTAMTEMGKISKKGFELFTTDETTIANEVISNNVKDLYLYDSKDFKEKDIYPTNSLNKNSIQKIDPTEEVDRENVNNKKVFQNEVRPSIGKDGFELNRINGWFKIDSEYYRWDINFFVIMFTLLISAVVIIFTIVKFVKLSIELAFSKIFTLGGALADIAHGQKTKQMLMHILSLYIAIMATGLTLNLYIVATGYMSNKVGGFTSILVNLALALFVIDGPNLLEKVFGVDAGLSSGLRLVMGINSGLDILSKLGKGLGAVGDMAKKGLEAGSIFGAGVKGFKDGAIPDLEDDIKKHEEEGFNPLIKDLPEGQDIKSLKDSSDNDMENDSYNNPNTPNNPDDDSNGGATFDDEIPGDLKQENSENDSISDLEDEVNKTSFENLGKISDLEDDINNVNSFDEDISSNGNSKFDSLNDEISQGNKGNFESISDFDDNISNLDKDSISNNLGSNGISNIDDSISDKNRKTSTNGSIATPNNKERQYYDNISGSDSQANKEWQDFKDFADGKPFANRSIYNKPNYINSDETRNLKDILSGTVKNKVDNIKNGELANKMKFSYKVGNNTAKDLNRYVGIKKEEAKDKIVAERIRRNL